MLDIDYLGEVNSPDGPPGLYDQSAHSPRERRGLHFGQAGSDLALPVAISKLPAIRDRLRLACAPLQDSISSIKRVSSAIFGPYHSIRLYAATDTLRSRQGEHGLARLPCLTLYGPQVAIDLIFAAGFPLDLHLR
eukprot:6178566-Pleurochrysis_carterae.AAC.9